MFRRTNNLLRRPVLTAVLLAALAGAPAALAGGFYLDVKVPATQNDARFRNAALVVRSSGCVSPKNTTLSATAEGLVDGKRRTLPLRTTSVAPGVFAIGKGWPKEGAWVVAITATNHGMICSALVTVGPKGEIAHKEKAVAARIVHGKLQAADIEAALQAAAARTITAAAVR